MRRSSRPLSWRKLGFFFGTIALAAIAAQGIARADNDGGITKVGQTTVPAVPITCKFSSTLSNTSSFSFDISWVDQAKGIYLLADRSHGTASADTEGGMLTNATGGDILRIDVANPGTYTTLTPPANDPFAG